MKELDGGFDGDTEEIKTEKYISSSGEEDLAVKDNEDKDSIAKNSISKN